MAWIMAPDYQSRAGVLNSKTTSLLYGHLIFHHFEVDQMDKQIDKGFCV